MSDAQSTTDETNSCRPSSSQDEVVNLVKIIALNQQENGEKMEKIASNQQENANEIKEQVKEEIKKIASKSCESEAAEQSKQALVSALASEYLILITTADCTVKCIYLMKMTKIYALKITKRMQFETCRLLLVAPSCDIYKQES